MGMPLIARVTFLFFLLLFIIGVWSSSAVMPAMFIVPMVSGTVMAFEASSGRPMWNFSTGGPLVLEPVASPQDVVLNPDERRVLQAVQRDGLQDLYPDGSAMMMTPFKSADGSIFLSHKHDTLFSLDPIDGREVDFIPYRTSEGQSYNSQYDSHHTKLNFDYYTCKPVLQLVRTEHTLETHNDTTIRKLSVAHIRAFLKQCPHDIDSHIEETFLPSLFITMLGDLQAVNSKGNLLWTFHIPSPYAQLVYGLTSHSIHPIRPRQLAESLKKVPLSLTNYKGTPYEMPLEAKPLGLPAPQRSTTEETPHKPIWYWIATICVCTAATIWGLIILKYQSRPKAVVPLPVPPPPPPAPAPVPTSSVTRSASTLQLFEEHEQLQKRVHELLRIQEQQKLQHLQQTQQLQELQQLQEQLQEQQIQQSNQAQTAMAVDAPVVTSRYRADFEEKHRIGEGGFGTVFLAVNKLDGVEYAVKKVCLTSGNARENDRVLREVRYLAQLDHPNIIRYYQSWMEEDEWDEWNECDEGETWHTNEDEDEVTKDRDKERSVIRFGNYDSDSSSRWDSIDSKSSIRIGFANDKKEPESSDAEPEGSESEGSESESENSESSQERTIQVVGKRQLAGIKRLSLDNTLERAYAYTSSPATNSRSGSPAKLRKPILYIQMQYCHQGTLHHWLSRTDRTVCAREAVAIFRQAVRGVVHIHSRNLIHRDLKPPNILISADGSVKIGDFGLSTGGPTDTCPQSPTRTLSRSHTTGVGSPLYCSPEQLNGERYDAKVDIFSLGVILFEMFHVFSTQMERVMHITQLREGIISDQTKEMYPELASLALQLVQTDPNLRPRAEEILAHPFML